jgi:YidC/Oxa1 family membrane protein insertase
MEGQGKRLLLAVALALGVMMVFQLIWKPKDEKKPPPATGSGSSLVVPNGKPVAPPIATAPQTPETAEEKIVLDAPELRATFSSFGGALVSWQLKAPKYEKDKSTQNKGELLPGRVGTGGFYVDFPRSDLKLPTNVAWKGTKVSDTVVKYELTAKPFKIEKEFTIEPKAYAVRMTVKVTLDVPAGQVVRQNLAVSSFAFQDPKVDMEGGQQIAARVWGSASMSPDHTVSESMVTDLIDHPTYATDVRWSGFEHPYMMQAYSPRRQPGEKIEKYGFAIGTDGLMRSDLVFPTAMVKAGDPPLQREVVAYLGPKSYKSLDAAGAFAGYSTGLPDTIDFGWFGVIGKPLLWLLLKFYNVVGNWGIAIMLLTFLVKAATLYWTTKSMRSMKAMASLAPQMKSLQEKYKNDKQRLQAETMALYKQHNVNPIAGCLPIFLQMPIWIALYRMLSNAGELYQEPFITGWINDLTATDPYHILPIILVVTMFVQARMQPATGDSRQQKFLQYGMPLMFGVMSFFFPSGLTIYIFTNTVLSALHSIYMNKFDKKSLALVAQMKKQQAEAEEANARIAAGKKPVAKPVIDTTATESDNDAPAKSNGAPKPGGPRKKKKKK